MSDISIAYNENPHVVIHPAPVCNNLSSICILGQDVDGTSVWVDQVRDEADHDFETMAMSACHCINYVTKYDADFESWFEQFKTISPETIRKKEYARLKRKYSAEKNEEFPSVGAISKDKSLIEKILKPLWEKHSEELTRREIDRQWQMIAEPGKFRDDTVVFLNSMWERFVKDHWKESEGEIRQSVEFLNTIDLSNVRGNKILHKLTNRDFIPEQWDEPLTNARQIIIIPSIDIGPYMMMPTMEGKKIYCIVPARKGNGRTSSDYDRTDLLVKLSALADETRLKIVEMTAAGGEITSQEIMDKLNLTQSSASRHLTQLSATGILLVDSSRKTKMYRPNPGRFNDIISALEKIKIGAEEDKY
jgi:DNA-binding transcriptional ArsR family regulator